MAFAEWLAITYGDRGVHVSCLCPMGVNTRMLNAGLDASDATALGAASSPRPARCSSPRTSPRRSSRRCAEERFLILPHPEVLEFFRRKGSDYDRWIAGMQRLQAHVMGGEGAAG